MSTEKDIDRPHRVGGEGLSVGHVTDADVRLLRELGKLLDLTSHGEAEKLRVIGAVEREPGAMRAEVDRVRQS
jgi:hypothetical protein